jgi:acetolactate synthase I/II/III large subunit
MMKVSDYIAARLADEGIRHVFMVTGGGAMHLNDSLGREGRIEFVCNHHEQACAIAAEGYARAGDTIGAACVTTGPGGTNAMTGVLGQWLDSIPVIVISGQVRTEVMVAPTGLPLRQVGDQEADIVALVRPITKYAVTVMRPAEIRYHLEKALFLARSGRPGPVWIDVPLDVQGAMVDESALKPYDPAEAGEAFDPSEVQRLAAEVFQRIRSAGRPVLLAGTGIRRAGACDVFQRVASRLHIPVLTAWNAIDLIAADHPCCFGNPGSLGQRGANFIFQNCDLLLSIGCRMSTRQTGYNFGAVARAAYRIMVDIDAAELQKPTFRPDLPIHGDAKVFLEALDSHLSEDGLPPKSEWLSWCRARVERYPAALPEYRRPAGPVNPYYFCEVLSHALADDDVVVSANGAACVTSIQTFRIRGRQRYIVNSGCAAMGYGLSAAIGACFARDRRRVVCLEGDGSLQMNVQELQTIVHHRLPIKLFVFNNDGYLSIRSTQKSFFGGHLVGESEQSGVSFPDFVKVAEAYRLPAVRIENPTRLAEDIRAALDAPGPILCDVRMDPQQEFQPRAASRRLPDGTMASSSLEDMYPFLERAEFLSNMLIPPVG